MPSIKNIFTNLPEKPLADELFETLLVRSNLKLERIISTGQVTPSNKWYQQDTAEWVLLLQGNTKIIIQGQGEHALTAGDYLLIPAHTQHRVSWTDPDQVCVWLALHIAERE